jgi:hypothetical protein
MPARTLVRERPRLRGDGALSVVAASAAFPQSRHSAVPANAHPPQPSLEQSVDILELVACWAQGARQSALLHLEQLSFGNLSSHERLRDQNREIARDHRIIISAPSLLVFMHPSFGSALR